VSQLPSCTCPLASDRDSGAKFNPSSTPSKRPKLVELLLAAMVFPMKFAQNLHRNIAAAIVMMVEAWFPSKSSKYDHAL